MSISRTRIRSCAVAASLAVATLSQSQEVGAPDLTAADVAGGPLLSAKAIHCIGSASEFHSVNPMVLLAIVRHESRGKPRTVSSNSNGSVDVGLTGINSIHFPELAKKGVMPTDLLDECVAIYVGAWKLSKKMATHGNTWWAIGAYHSETPQYNVRYQNRIWRELKTMGVVQKPLRVAGR